MTLIRWPRDPDHRQDCHLMNTHIKHVTKKESENLIEEIKKKEIFSNNNFERKKEKEATTRALESKH